MKRPDSSLVALTVGALGSAAANTAWTWPDPVRVAAGLLTTALLPVSLHFWPRVPAVGRRRWLRAFIMTMVCAAAAGVNLAHAVMLLVKHGEDPRLAVPTVAAIELVVVMASLARRTPEQDAGVGRRQDSRTVERPVSSSPAVPQDVPQDAGRDAVSAVLQPALSPSYSPTYPAAPAAPAVLSRPVEASCAGEGTGRRQDAEEDTAQDIEQDTPQDGAQDAGQDAQDTPPNTETDPLRWAVTELSAGRPAGYVSIGRRFPDLSERKARDVARDARKQDAGLHLVSAGQDRTA